MTLPCTAHYRTTVSALPTGKHIDYPAREEVILVGDVPYKRTHCFGDSSKALRLRASSIDYPALFLERTYLMYIED
jgi:hypothetical protein